MGTQKEGSPEPQLTQRLQWRESQKSTPGVTDSRKAALPPFEKPLEGHKTFQHLYLWHKLHKHTGAQSEPTEGRSQGGCCQQLAGGSATQAAALQLDTPPGEF